MAQIINNINNLREVTDDIEPGSLNISMKGGKAKSSFWYEPSGRLDFENVVLTILGSNRSAGLDNLGPGPPPPGPRAGGIKRFPPKRHPRFMTLVAETITNMVGEGGKFVFDRALTDGVPGPDADYQAKPYKFPDPIPNYALYPIYKIDVEFANRLYNLTADVDLPASTAQVWFDDVGDGVAPGKLMKYWDTGEYLRWTWITGGPKENIITAKQGQMVLDVGNPVKNYQFADMPKMTLPDGAVKITWYEVPWNFVRPVVASYSYFQQYQGRVNYTTFLNWGPGELLYLTIQPRPYVMPIPLLDGTVQILCDIDILCAETKRLRAIGDAVPNPALTNWVANGFNLQPFWLDKQFHYAHSLTKPDQPTTQSPSWRSFPMQILFSDPDVVQPALTAAEEAFNNSPPDSPQRAGYQRPQPAPERPPGTVVGPDPVPGPTVAEPQARPRRQWVRAQPHRPPSSPTPRER